MSYNITHSKVERIENFSVPIQEMISISMEIDQRAPDHKLDRDLHSTFKFLGGELKGAATSIGNTLFLDCSSIDLYGEGSGFLFKKILRPLFKKSKGLLEMKFVWEGGDSFSKLIVKDGEVNHEEIEF